MSHDVTQVVIALTALLSIVIATRSLVELRKDRLARVRPYLAFQPGGNRIPVVRRTGGADGPYYWHGDEGRPWGRLGNHGLGTALYVNVEFVTIRAFIAKAELRLTPASLAEYPYSPERNAFPSSPSHIAAGREAQLFRLPRPVVDDNMRRDRVEGIVIIRSRDLYRREHVTYQEFRGFGVRRDEGTNDDYVVVTFSKELSEDEASKLLSSVGYAIPPEPSRVSPMLGRSASRS